MQNNPAAAPLDMSFAPLPSVSHSVALQVAAEALHTGAQMVHVVRPQPPSQPPAKLQVGLTTAFLAYLSVD